jgi:hypothetical protein
MTRTILGIRIDERFLEHRRRSTSIASLTGALVAYGLFMYRYLAQHRLSWDLFAVIAAMALVKVGMMIWYRATD